MDGGFDIIYNNSVCDSKMIRKLQEAIFNAPTYQKCHLIMVVT